MEIRDLNFSRKRMGQEISSVIRVNKKRSG